MTIDNQVIDGVAAQNQGASQPVMPAQEKLLPQEHVNELVRDAKEKAFQKGYQQAVAEKKTPDSTQSNAAFSQPGNSPEDLRRIAAEEFGKHQQKMQEELQKQQYNLLMQQHINEINSKISVAKQEYPDFDSVFSKIPKEQVPDATWMMINQFPNAGDMLYELSKSPEKFASVIQTGNAAPGFAMQMLSNLSNSIQQNKTAAAAPRSPEPLSQLKPSTASVDSGSASTIRDYKKMFRG